MVSGIDVIKVLFRAGFQQVRQKGSHVFMKHIDGRCTTVPMHREINRTTLNSILHQVSMSRDEFLKLYSEL